MSAVVAERAAQQRVASLQAPGRTEIVTGAVPGVQAGQVRVRLEGCGVCASSLPVWEGRPWFEYPRPAGSPGHEGWGRVDAVGDGVEDLAPGDRVALISGQAYAEYDVADRAAVIRIPDEFGDVPFPGEPLGCAMNIWDRSDVRAGHTVAIVGSGFLGLLVGQLAKRAGARVVAISRRAAAREWAKRTGADETVPLDDPWAARQAAMDLTGGRGYDRVIEAAGLQQTLDVASGIAAEYGRLVIAGYHQDGLRQVDLQSWNWRALDVINAHERSVERYASGVQRAVEAIQRGDLDPFPLLTHTLPIERLDDAFELTRSRPDSFVKAVVTIGGAR
jgi:threonine dehydrogenase-like Zn-dependent dehydrogenase